LEAPVVGPPPGAADRGRSRSACRRPRYTADASGRLGKERSMYFMAAFIESLP